MTEDEEPFLLLNDDDHPSEDGGKSEVGSPRHVPDPEPSSEGPLAKLGRVVSGRSLGQRITRGTQPPPSRSTHRREDDSASVGVDSMLSLPHRDEVIEGDMIRSDGEGVLSLDGIHTFDWPLRGMDCPDCAMKATRASKRLPGVKEVRISAITGRASIDLDLGVGRVSRVSSVLSSLGHDPDLVWDCVDGRTPKSVMESRGLDRKGLRRSLLQTPGVLDVELSEGRILILRVPMFEIALSDESDRMLASILGGRARLVPHISRNLRPDQWRLLGAFATIPALGLVTWMESGSTPTAAILLVTAVSILFAGWRMFGEALAGIRNLVLGFQMLVALAIAGALWLGEYQEALMVTGLVAFSSHLEERALVRARAAMQGGLDRMPPTARLLSQAVTPHSQSSTDSPISIHAGSESSSSCSAAECSEDTCTPDSIPVEAASDCSDADCTDAACDTTPVNTSIEPSSEVVPIELVSVGDRVEIRSGEIVPVDGRIVEGSGSIDRAPLTGESIPTDVSSGDLLEAGLTLVRGPVVLDVEATGDDTRLSGLVDLVRNYRDRPPRLQGAVEMFTFVWVPIVLVGAALIGLLTGDLTTTLLLWVVSCPCALLLAAPIPHATSLSVASSRGVVARGGDVLEKVALVDLALLDKTGTLTSGRPRFDALILTEGADESRALRLAAGLEQRSNHPYAESIIGRLGDRGLDPMQITGISDGEAGVSGSHRGEVVRIGRADWLQSEGVVIPSDLSEALADARAMGAGASLLAEGDDAIALFQFVHDDARPGAAELVTALRERGVEVELLSGDEQKAVERFGSDLGIDASQCRGGVTPEEKATWIEGRTATRRTMMAGDGFNDAAALALADVGIAVGSGDQVNLDAADVLVPGDDPRAIDSLIDIARRARWLVIANLALSVLLTMTLVTLVVSGVEISITAGVLLHEASALLVILNGMWVGGTLSERLGTLGGIFADVGRDLVEAIRQLMGRLPEPATD